jgi:hypothetical protein
MRRIRKGRAEVRCWYLGAVVAGLLSAAPALAAPVTGHPAPDMLPVLAALALILVSARLGGALFERFHLPAVLGELAAGVLLGNLGLVGFHGLDSMKSVPTVEAFAQVGVLFLLFQVGLASDIGKLAAVGWSATLVAVLGVITPMLLGFGVSTAFLRGQGPLTHWFVGATLTATSVGITARVLGDLKRTTSVEGRIILGAAVIDDVLGLIVLAVVSGLIAAANAGRAFDATGLALIVAKAIGFLGVAWSRAAGSRASRSGSPRGCRAKGCWSRSGSRSASWSRSSPAGRAWRRSWARSPPASCWRTSTTRRSASATRRSAT